MKIEYKGQIEYKEFNISFKVVDLPIYSEKKYMIYIILLLMKYLEKKLFWLINLIMLINFKFFIIGI
jgi:hypothetical protein